MLNSTLIAHSLRAVKLTDQDRRDLGYDLVTFDEVVTQTLGKLIRAKVYQGEHECSDENCSLGYGYVAEYYESAGIMMRRYADLRKKWGVMFETIYHAIVAAEEMSDPLLAVLEMVPVALMDAPSKNKNNSDQLLH